MSKKEIQQVIENVIQCTFNSIEVLYKGEIDKLQDIRLRFPKKTNSDNNKKPRLSEQELRFIFVEEFCKNDGVNKFNLHYSVETPTNDQYMFSGKSKRAGNFDMTIHQNDDLVAIIEFKANNRKIETDLKKLTNPEEGDVLRYFINILKASDQRTIDNLNGKYNKNKKGNNTVHIRIHSIENPEHNDYFPKCYKY